MLRYFTLPISILLAFCLLLSSCCRHASCSKNTTAGDTRNILCQVIDVGTDAMDTVATVVHAGVQLLVWLWLLPLSILVARKKFQYWFTAHRAANVTAFVFCFGAILTVLIQHSIEDSGESHDHGSHDHRRLSSKNDEKNPHVYTGWAVFGILGFQIIIGLVHPDEKSGKRNIWRITHRVCGFTVVLFAIAQTMLGFVMKATIWKAIALILAIFLPLLVVLWGVSYHLIANKEVLGKAIDIELTQFESESEPQNVGSN